MTDKLVEAVTRAIFGMDADEPTSKPSRAAGKRAILETLRQIREPSEEMWAMLAVAEQRDAGVASGPLTEKFGEPSDEPNVTPYFAGAPLTPAEKQKAYRERIKEDPDLSAAATEP